MAQPAARPPPVPDPARRPPRRRALVGAGAALAALLALPLVGWLAANTPPAKAAIRDRLQRALAARVPDAVVAGDVRIDARLRAVFGPLALPSARPGAPPVLAVGEVAVRPRWRALLRGRLEAASVTLTDVRVDAGPGGAEARRLLARLRGRGAAEAGAAGAGERAEPPALRLEALRVRAELRPGLVAELGPISARALPRRDGAGSALDVLVELPGGGRAEARLSRGAPAEVRLAGLRAEALPEAIRRRLPFAVEAGTLAGELRADGGALSFDLRLADLSLRGARLSTGALGPLSLSARGAARIGPDGAATVEGARVGLAGEPGVEAEVSLRLDPGPAPRAALRVAAPAVDWAALLRALPPALALGPDAPPLAGTFALRLELEGPLRRAGPWRLDGALDLGGLRRAGPSRLDGAFVQAPRRDLGVARAVVVGPTNPDFVPVASLPLHVVRAVTASEDAGFFGHRGIDFQELAAALAEGARRGRLRGASTITQQLAKNAFLDGERSLARKAREALLAVALEASLSKARILEVYLNVAEWGPGVVGLGEAARHYFGKPAQELTPREAAFLATIIPNPVRYHAYCARGALTPAWEARVDGLLLRLHELEVLSADELAVALGERLVFTHG